MSQLASKGAIVFRGNVPLLRLRPKEACRDLFFRIGNKPQYLSGAVVLVTMLPESLEGREGWSKARITRIREV